MSQPAPRATQQTKEALLKSYSKRLKDDVKSMLDNFTEILKLTRVDDETQVLRATQTEQDHLEMHVRAANMVRAAESLLRLVSDLKQYLILNDFPSINEALSNNSAKWMKTGEDIDAALMTLRDDIASELLDTEEEYYSSLYK